MRVLCADDHELMLDLLETVLTNAGHTVVVCRDGLEAWRAVQAASPPYDLVLTDHQMPRWNGLRLVEKLRETGRPVRIGVQSGNLSPADAAAYQALRVDFVLPKPVIPAILLSEVKRMASP